MTLSSHQLAQAGGMITSICVTSGNPKSRCYRKTRSRSVRVTAKGKLEGCEEKQRASLQQRTCPAHHRTSFSAISSSKRTWAVASEARRRGVSEVSALLDEIHQAQAPAMVVREVACRKESDKRGVVHTATSGAPPSGLSAMGREARARSATTAATCTNVTRNFHRGQKTCSSTIARIMKSRNIGHSDKALPKSVYRPQLSYIGWDRICHNVVGYEPDFVCFAFVAFTSAASWMFGCMHVSHHDPRNGMEGRDNDCWRTGTDRVSR